jgi:transposase
LEFDRMIMAWHRSNQTSKRLHYIPGVGPMLATALVAKLVSRPIARRVARLRSLPSMPRYRDHRLDGHRAPATNRPRR